MLRGPEGAVDGAFRRGAPNRAVGDSYMPARVAMAWWMFFLLCVLCAISVRASDEHNRFAHAMPGAKFRDFGSVRFFARPRVGRAQPACFVTRTRGSERIVDSAYVRPIHREKSPANRAVVGSHIAMLSGSNIASLVLTSVIPNP